MKAIPGEKNEGKENKRGNMYRQMMTVLKLVEGRYSTHKKIQNNGHSKDNRDPRKRWAHLGGSSTG